jgi:hypothetical protein
MIGTFTTDGGRNRHLRHDGRPTPPDQTPVDQQHIRTMACGFERGIHASTAGTDHKNVGRQMHCFSPQKVLGNGYRVRQLYRLGSGVVRFIL